MAPPRSLLLKTHFFYIGAVVLLCFVLFVFRTGTYDNVKALVGAGAVSLLLDAARAFQEDSGTVSWVYLALKQLAANDDSVKLVRYLLSAG